MSRGRWVRQLRWWISFRSRLFFAGRRICCWKRGRSGKIVNIKKGQFVAPHDIHHAAEKVASTGNAAGDSDGARVFIRV